MNELIGKTMGNYEILEQVGRGGVASVYRAKDKVNDREVALKVLAPQLAMDETFRERFKREAKVLTDLDHTHIVPILDYGEAQGLTFIVLPFMQVGSLSDRMRNGPLAPRDCSPVIKQVATALKHAHDSGVIHRDVKPSNILMDGDEKAWLSDFGFAHVHGASLSLTGSTLVGTPAYMSPEQVRGEALSPGSDQYALGMVLYQMTTGYLPYEADTPMATAIRQATEPLPRPRWINPEIPDAVEQVLKRALSKKPEDRYEDVIKFHDALEDAIADSYDPETGDLLPGAIGEEPVTEAFDADLEGMDALKPWYARLPARVTLILLLCAIPLTVWAATAFQSDTSGKALSAAQTQVWKSIMASATAGGGISTEELPTVIAANLTALARKTENGESDTLAGPDEEGLTAIAMASSLPSATPTLIPSETVMRTSAPFFAYSTPTMLKPTSRPPKATISPLPPTPTNTSPPPPTNTPQPPAPAQPQTEDVCKDLILGSFSRSGKKVRWSFKNKSGSTVTISRISIVWPDGGGQRLNSIAVGGSTVWRGNASESPTSASGVGKSVGVGSTVRITVTFKKAAASGGYGIRVKTTNGCQKSSSG